MHEARLNRCSARPCPNNPKPVLSFVEGSKSSPADANPKWLGVVAIAITIFLHGAFAQAQMRMPKIGWLSANSGVNRGQTEIVRMLRALGYIEGKNIVYEFRYADNKLDRLPSMADELVRLKVDLLVTPGTPGALALKKATRTVPIMFLDVTDPVAAGLVDSLARPGGNVTGFSSVEALLAGKRLELLKDTVAKLSRVAALWDPHNPSSTQEWQESQTAARELGLQLYSLEVSSADKYEKAFKDASKARCTALAVLSTSLASANQERIAELAVKYRLPAVYVQENFITAGGLMSYGPDQTERYRRVAVFVDKILKGAKPADLPVEQPTKFDFIVNLKAARQIGLTIPPNVLARANKVIQ